MLALNLTLQNLEEFKSKSQNTGEQDSDDEEEEDGEGLRWKWVLVGGNQVWAKKMWLLLQELQKSKPQIYEEFKDIRTLHLNILGPFFISDDDT